jgi:hypothetical protein
MKIQLKQCSKHLAMLVAFGLLSLPETLVAQPVQQLSGHVPKVLSGMTPVAVLPDTTPIDLIIGLPLRNPEEIQSLLKDMYDPNSPHFHKYLSPQQYVDSYGPTAASYQALLDFAKANNLAVITTPPNRKFVHVRATAATVDKVFHVTLRQYRHPTENRLFYAPDVEPSVEPGIPISHISGLDNLHLPGRFPNHSEQTQNDAAIPAPAAGSGSGGLYTGGDFRAAYAPGVSLTGQGQNVGIIELNGYNQSDLNVYEATNHIPNVPIQNVYLDGYSGGNPNSESAADIELVMSMAPGISKAIVYGAPYTTSGIHELLNEMVFPTKGEPLPHQITTSYYFFYDQLVYDALTELALQGQALFVASGDYGSYDETTGGGAFPPSDFPYVTSVGGTELVTSGPGGHWVSESAAGFSGGGYSPWAATDSHFVLPSYQYGMNLSLAHGSTTARNGPDVAMVADNISIYVNGKWQRFAGTSAAAPLWAGFMALANERAANLGAPQIGFANPALYSAGRSATCPSCFHDITVGDNFNDTNPTLYKAVKGFDLVTGWGSPGTSLIDVLASYGTASEVTISRSTGKPCGTTCPGWVMLDDNGTSVSIAASGTDLYQVRQSQTKGTGQIWKSTGIGCTATYCPGWIMLDDNPAVAAIAADANNLYQLHNTGKIWKSTGVACSGSFCPGWIMLDDNPAAVAIAASGGNLYQLHDTGSIWQSTGIACSGSFCPGWIMLDDNPAATAIAADGANLYQLHDTGSIWKSTGVACSGSFCPGWVMLDDNPAAIAIAASGGNLYQLHSNGQIWKSTGEACSGSFCPGWVMLDDNAAAIAIVADGNNLYQLHINGTVWKWNGTACTGVICPGWTELDNNSLTTQIAAGGGALYQLNGRL